jgi:iron complex transport system substrate-binding protein
MIHRRLFTGVLLAALAATAAVSQVPQTQKSKTQAASQRFVSAAPSLTELLYALGLGDQIVGVDRFSRYPPEATKKAQIGDYVAPNLETITSMKPTLVLITKNPVNLKARLEALRLKVLEVDQETLPNLFNSIRAVGEATGSKSAASQLTATMRMRLDEIHRKASTAKPTRMMFVVGRTPNRLDGITVVGGPSFLSELIALAGGDNIFKDAKAAYPQVTMEEVLARNPDVILDMGDMADTAGVTPARERGVVELWNRAGSLSAVKNHRVHAIGSDVFFVPGPRIVDAAQSFLTLLHPEVSK